MKLKIVLLPVLLALLLGACAQKKAWTGDPQLVYKLTMKMPEDDVRKILGEPSDTMELKLPGVKTVAWIYNGKEQVRVILQDGKLVGAEIGYKKVLEASASEI